MLFKDKFDIISLISLFDLGSIQAGSISNKGIRTKLREYILGCGTMTELQPKVFVI